MVRNVIFKYWADILSKLMQLNTSCDIKSLFPVDKGLLHNLNSGIISML